MSERLRLAAFAFGLAALVGALASYAVFRNEHAAAQARLDKSLATAANLVDQRLREGIAFLTATRSFFETQPAIPARPTFATFVRGLGVDGPRSGLQGIGFARIVPQGSEAEILAGMARDYGPDQKIWPQSRESLRTAIVLLEPDDDRNRAAIGFDMYSEPRRRAAMARARSTGKPAATAPLTLVQEITDQHQSGILIYVPLGARPVPGTASGFVYAPVRLGDLFSAALGGARQPAGLAVSDAEAPDVAVFRNKDAPPDAAQRGLTSSLRMPVAGRTWVFSAQEPATADLAGRYPFTLVTATGAVLLSIATAMAAHGQAAAVGNARQLAAARDRSVREKDLHLREMSHRLKNALARVSAIARQTARSTATKEDFVASLTARLQAMGNAQDMLTRSGTDSADLRMLLASELRQIYGDHPAAQSLDGPDVRLSQRQTQALGLTFHELATNSLKYGAGADTAGALHIGWAVTTAPAGRMLTLTWEETTAEKPVEPERTGFGSQLVESCIGAELGGTIARRYHDGGLTIDIAFPLDPV